MRMVNIQSAKTHLSRLVEEAVSGKEIVIAKAGKPLVRLVPYQLARERRKLGMLEGKVQEAKGCWDADPELESLFYEAENAEQSSLVVKEEK